MIVMKFGGTSVGSPERMKEVANLVTKSGNPTFVVLSAMSGTTNTLIEVSDYLYKKNHEGANDVLNKLEQKYLEHIEKLYSTEEYKAKTREFLTQEFAFLRSFTNDIFTSFEEKKHRCTRRSYFNQHGCQLLGGKRHKGKVAQCTRFYANRQECRT